MSLEEETVRGKLKELYINLDSVSILLEKRNIKMKHEESRERKYNIRGKSLNIIMEEMKQRIMVVGAKIKRFNSRINQYRQNRMFFNDQGRFFQRLNNKEEDFQCQFSNSVEAQTFWRGIRIEEKKYPKDAEWLRYVKKELEQDEGQDKIDIIKDQMMRVSRKMKNWKIPGPGNVQG